MRGLTASPQANTACPAAKILRDAFTSAFNSKSHAPHLNTAWLKRLSLALDEICRLAFASCFILHVFKIALQFYAYIPAINGKVLRVLG